MKTAVLAALLAGFASPAFADLQVRFDEGAPKDRFTITNTGACALGAASLTIDLGGSPYGLIFDVTGKGAGVEVFQPFELVSGGEVLNTVPRVSDGDSAVTLDLTGLDAGASLAFTIDVDDTADALEITVSDSEIVGAGVVLETAAGSATASFEKNAIANIAWSGCSS
ncbi:aggregation factor core [Hoeflea prorocentri]|uniref:Aggregation factor core n=1 Tax=Hoeflea prorocentri TaxID=1922333 RepID=A0A9X3ZHR0_9HYPH|nr:aggregation factor core [Hoeflea prorocentri]MCY6382107.1 aggregation factor core [Hoeflea prorocentri]MDA5399907.1 aggregation factor core [Hoeflea prorocentri]